MADCSIDMRQSESVIEGTVLAKAELTPGEIFLVVLSDSRLYCPIPDEGTSPLWTADVAQEAFVGCQLEMVTSGYEEFSAVPPHGNNDLLCSELRKSGDCSSNAVALAKAVGLLVKNSMQEVWPKEFTSTKSPRHLLPGIDMPSVAVLLGSIACLYEVPHLMATFNSVHRADLQFADRGLGAIPVAGADLQASRMTSSPEGYLVLALSRPENFNGEELCAILLMGYLPCSAWENDDALEDFCFAAAAGQFGKKDMPKIEAWSNFSTVSFNDDAKQDHDRYAIQTITSSPTSEASELPSVSGTRASSSEVFSHEDLRSAPVQRYGGEPVPEVEGPWEQPPGDWKSNPAQHEEQGNPDPDEWILGWVSCRRLGCCMVECIHPRYRMQVAIYRSIAALSSLSTGDVVFFRIQEKQKGQCQAAAPIWKLVAEAEYMGCRNFGRYTGELKRIGTNGIGLVHLEEHAENDSVCLDKDAIDLGNLDIGDQISFNLEYDASGTLWVSKPFWKQCTRDTAACDYGDGDSDDCDDDVSDVSEKEDDSPTTLAYGTSVKSALATIMGSQAADEFHSATSSKRFAKKAQSPAGFALEGDARADGYYSGRVRRAEQNSGFVVECPDLADEDVCLDTTIMKRSRLRVNDIISFRVRINKFGLREVQNPVWKFLGEAAGVKKLPGLGKYTGEVSAMVKDEYGIVECQEGFSKSGRAAGDKDDECQVHQGRDRRGDRAYILAVDMQAWKVAVGDLLRFDLNYSSEGRPLVGKSCWKNFSHMPDALPPSHSQAERYYIGDKQAKWQDADQEDAFSRRHRLRDRSRNDSWKLPGDWNSWDDYSYEEDFRDTQRPPLRHPLQHRSQPEAWEPGWGPSVWSPQWGHPSSPSKGGALWTGKGDASSPSKGKALWAGKGDALWAGWAGKGDALWAGKGDALWAGKGACPGKGWSAWSSPVADSLTKGKGSRLWLDESWDAWQNAGWDAWPSDRTWTAGAPLRRRDGKEAGTNLFVSSVKYLYKAYTYLECPSDLDGLVYLDRSLVEPRTLTEGDMIACQVRMNHEGTPEASSPVWKLMKGKYAGGTRDDFRFGRHTGLVSYYSKSGAHGFVRSRSTVSEYGEENVYIHASVFDGCGLEVADRIAFHVHNNKEGKPQVSAPVWKLVG